MIIVVCPHSNTFMLWLFASIHGFTALMIDSSIDLKAKTKDTYLLA